MLIFIYGYIFAGDIRFRETIETHRWAAFASALATFALMYYWSVHNEVPPAGYNSSYLIFTAVRCLNSWSLVIALLGFGSKYLTFNNNLLKYVTQLILPFYILHQTVILTIGFFVVQWDLSIAAKYLVISTSSLIIIMLLYELLIKRFNILRFLFGLKTKKI